MSEDQDKNTEMLLDELRTAREHLSIWKGRFEHAAGGWHAQKDETDKMADALAVAQKQVLSLTVQLNRQKDVFDCAQLFVIASVGAASQARDAGRNVRDARIALSQAHEKLAMVIKDFGRVETLERELYKAKDDALDKTYLDDLQEER